MSYTQTQWEGEYDDPKTIIDEAVKAQNNLLCGFFGNDKANKEKLEESLENLNLNKEDQKVVDSVLKSSIVKLNPIEK